MRILNINYVNLRPHKSAIQQLEPLSEIKFKYNRTRWQHLNNEFSTSITHFENLDISRQDVINSYKDFYESKTEWMTPFLLTMVWGFGETGYGTYRTNNYLSKESNHLIIKEALQAVYNLELEVAYL